MNVKLTRPGDVVVDLILQSLALLLSDHLALSLGLGGADLLHAEGALLLGPGGALLILGGALLILDSGALLLVNSSPKWRWHIHTALLRHAVILVLEDLLTLLLHIGGGLTLPLDLGPAVTLGLYVLNWTLGDLTLPLVGVGGHSVQPGPRGLGLDPQLEQRQRRDQVERHGL